MHNDDGGDGGYSLLCILGGCLGVGVSESVLE